MCSVVTEQHKMDSVVLQFCACCNVLRENEHEIEWIAEKIWEELREGKEKNINIYYMDNLKIKMIKIKTYPLKDEDLDFQPCKSQ